MDYGIQERSRFILMNLEKNEKVFVRHWSFSIVCYFPVCYILEYVLPDRYFYFRHLRYITLLIILHFYLSSSLNAGLFLETEYFNSLVLLLLIK